MTTARTGRKDKAALTAALARHVEQTRVALGGAAEGLRRVDQAVLNVLVFTHQPRQIIPPDRLTDLVARGEANPATVLAVLQELAAQGEPWATILADLQRLADSIRPPGQVHVPILYYRAEDGAWVVYSGHRRCLASLLAGRDAVPAIEVRGRTEGERELDRIAIETSHADWTAIEQALALRTARDQLRAEWAGKTLAELGLEEPGTRLSLHVDTESSEPGSDSAGTDSLSVHVDTQTNTDEAKPLTGRRLDGIVTVVMLHRTGVSRLQFYRLLALAEKLSPDAQTAAQQFRLSEGQLRPVTRLTDRAQQWACVQAIAQHGLTSVQAEVLAAAVLAGADPAAEAARLADAARPPAPAPAPGPARPRPVLPPPPPALRPAGRGLWRAMQRAQRDLGWVLEEDQRAERVARLNRDEREVLRSEVVGIRAICELLSDVLDF